MRLALVIDAYLKQIIGYDLSERLNAQGAVRALNMAIKNRIYPQHKLIHHSDWRVQYSPEISSRGVDLGI